MAFDENGQADNYFRRIQICERAYKILTKKVHFPPEDIIFDPNIFPVATGMDEHKTNAIDFFKCCEALLIVENFYSSWRLNQAPLTDRCLLEARLRNCELANVFK